MKKSHSARSWTACAVIAGVSLATGCSSDPAEVSSSEFKEVQKAHSEVSIGMSKKDVLKAYEDALTKRLSEATISGVRVEEWKAEAVRGSGDDKDIFVSFLYFANDKLIDMRDKRWKYQDDPALAARLKQ